MDPLDRELKLIVEEMVSPKARSAMLARYAREEIETAKVKNEVGIGRQIRPPRITVDGKAGAALGTVKPDGTIVAEFNIETDAVRWVLREVELISPRLSGAYERSHVVYADGRELQQTADLPDAAEFVIVSDLAYARKLDPKDGLPARSKKAPKGVYAAISAVAATRFGREANIRFTFREVSVRSGGTMRNPAIVVRPR